MRLLLIEDDLPLSNYLKTELVNAGFAVDMACDGEQGEFMGSKEQYDIAILDLGLPKCSGIEVLRMWRLKGNTLPVIVLTARDAWQEKADGFNAGADDYLGKPFHTEELLARIHAMLRRLHDRAETRLSLFGVVLDEETHTVCVDGRQPLELTAMEFRLLRYFMANPGKILAKSYLLEHVYELNNNPDSNVIEVYVNRLRRKLDKDLIATRRGQGYIFGDKSLCH